MIPNIRAGLLGKHAVPLGKIDYFVHPRPPVQCWKVKESESEQTPDAGRFRRYYDIVDTC